MDQIANHNEESERMDLATPYEKAKAEYLSVATTADKGTAHSAWEGLLAAYAATSALKTLSSGMEYQASRVHAPVGSTLEPEVQPAVLSQLREAFDIISAAILRSSEAKQLSFFRVVAQLFESSNAPTLELSTGRDPSSLQTHIVEFKRAMIHTATIVGEVTEVDDHKVVVKFSDEGESEEREFFWSQIKVEKGSLVRGDRVKGRTELERLPRLDENKARAALTAIREKAATLAHGMANDSAPHVTPEAQEAADRARNIQ